MCLREHYSINLQQQAGVSQRKRLPNGKLIASSYAFVNKLLYQHVLCDILIIKTLDSFSHLKYCAVHVLVALLCLIPIWRSSISV